MNIVSVGRDSITVQNEEGVCFWLSLQEFTDTERKGFVVWETTISNKVQ